MSPTPASMSDPTEPASYSWEATNEEVARRYGLPVDAIIRFDLNTSPAAPAARLSEVSGILPGLNSPSVIPLAHDGMIAIHAVVEADAVWGLLPRLKAAGASGILVLPIEKIVA